jgi:hypothetical protein
MDDARVFQFLEVDERYEDQRIFALFDPVFELAVDLEPHRARAVSALGAQSDGERFVSQVPLHEGHGKGVDRSRRVSLLARTEAGAVRGLIHRHGVSPGDRVPLASEQKGEVLLEVVQNGFDAGEGQVERLGNMVRRQRSASPGQLGHGEVAHSVMIVGHEPEARPRLPSSGFDDTPPQEPGDWNHVTAEAEEQSILHELPLGS